MVRLGQVSLGLVRLGWFGWVKLGHVQVTVTVRSRISQGQVTVRSRSRSVQGHGYCHGQVTARDRLRSRSGYIHGQVTATEANGHGKVRLGLAGLGWVGSGQVCWVGFGLVSLG